MSQEMQPFIVEFFAHLPTILWLGMLHHGMRHYIPNLTTDQEGAML